MVVCLVFSYVSSDLQQTQFQGEAAGGVSGVHLSVVVQWGLAGWFGHKARILAHCCLFSVLMRASVHYRLHT
jgi:hypothetical protein